METNRNRKLSRTQIIVSLKLCSALCPFTMPTIDSQATYWNGQCENGQFSWTIQNTNWFKRHVPLTLQWIYQITFASWVWSWTWIHDPSDGGMDWLFHNERLSFFSALFPLQLPPTSPLLVKNEYLRSSFRTASPSIKQNYPFLQGCSLAPTSPSRSGKLVFEGKGKSCNVLSQFLKDWTAELAQVAMSTKGFAKQPVRTSQRGWKETLSRRGLHGNNEKYGLFNSDMALKAPCTLNRLNCARSRSSWRKVTGISVRKGTRFNRQCNCVPKKW